MEDTEQQAIQACQKGDLVQFSVLYDKYIKKIYDFIYFRTYHQQTAEDLASSVFLKAIERITSYKFQKGAFSSWLYQIARNTIIDYYRTQKQITNIDSVWGLRTDEDVEIDIDTKEKLKEVRRYLDKIDKEQQEVILMRIWDGLSYKEIAEITKKSETSLKMMFSRSINKLRKEQALILIILLLTIKFSQMIR